MVLLLVHDWLAPNEIPNRAIESFRPICRGDVDAAGTERQRRAAGAVECETAWVGVEIDAGGGNWARQRDRAARAASVAEGRGVAVGPRRVGGAGVPERRRRVPSAEPSVRLLFLSQASVWAAARLGIAARAARKQTTGAASRRRTENEAIRGAPCSARKSSGRRIGRLHGVG